MFVPDVAHPGPFAAFDRYYLASITGRPHGCRAIRTNAVRWQLAGAIDRRALRVGCLYRTYGVDGGARELRPSRLGRTVPGSRRAGDEPGTVVQAMPLSSS